MKYEFRFGVGDLVSHKCTPSSKRGVEHKGIVLSVRCNGSTNHYEVRSFAYMSETSLGWYNEFELEPYVEPKEEG